MYFSEPIQGALKWVCRTFPTIQKFSVMLCIHGFLPVGMGFNKLATALCFNEAVSDQVKGKGIKRGLSSCTWISIAGLSKISKEALGTKCLSSCHSLRTLMRPWTQIDLGGLCSDSFHEVTSALQYLLYQGKQYLGFTCIWARCYYIYHNPLSHWVLSPGTHLTNNSTTIDWRLHSHCIFCIWNPLKNHVIEPKMFRCRRGLRNYLAQTIYSKAQESATHLGKVPSHSFTHSVNINGAPSWSVVGTVLDLGAKQWTRGANFFPWWNGKNRQIG